MLSAKWLPFCRSLDVLTCCDAGFRTHLLVWDPQDDTFTLQALELASKDSGRASDTGKKG